MNRLRRFLAPSVRLLLVLFGVVGLLAIPGPAPAAADPFGWEPGAPNLLADSLDHWYCTPAIAESNRTHYNSAMAHLDAATDLYDVNSGDSCGSSTDVAFIETDLNGPLGRAQCVSAVPNTLLCDSAWVLVDNAEHWSTAAYCGSSAAELTGNFIITTRHELGHTVGLSHTPPIAPTCGGAILGNDPMTSDWVRNQPLSIFNYNLHHIGHVNNFYN